MQSTLPVLLLLSIHLLSFTLPFIVCSVFFYLLRSILFLFLSFLPPLLPSTFFHPLSTLTSSHTLFYPPPTSPSLHFFSPLFLSLSLTSTLLSTTLSSVLFYFLSISFSSFLPPFSISFHLFMILKAIHMCPLVIKSKADQRVKLLEMHSNSSLFILFFFTFSSLPLFTLFPLPRGI